MDFLHALPTTRTAAIFASSLVLFLYCLLRILSRRICKKGSPPKASGAWPFLGHLPLLGGQQPPQVTLGDMADKYGPIFTIKMGVYRTLVVSNWEMAKECLTTNDKVFANRPKMLLAEVMGYNYAMIGFSPYGPYWRQVRKIAVLELLSNHRLHTFKHVRETEMKAAVKEIYEFWDKNKTIENKASLDMKKWFGDITLNVIYKIILGKRYVGTTTVTSDDEGEENDQWRVAVRRFFELAGKFVVADALPFLRWLDLGGHEKAMKKTAEELDYHVQGWLEEHKQKRVSGKIKSDDAEDFMDVMLSILEDAELSTTSDADRINKATCLALIMAASDTTRVTLTWALSHLLNNGDVLKKAQQELDTFIDRERLPNESDMKNLVYLQAIIKETLRLNPAAPLSVPHESLEDCTVGGYHVPAGTRLLVNIWKIHRDPRVWSDPHEFKPERFLTTHKDFDVKGQNLEFIPFGSGRRMCPGFSFALQIMQLALATLLHGFEIGTMFDDAPVDLDSKLEALLTPRLPAYLY